MYRKFMKQKSILSSKKTVIFLVSREKQIFTEFTENTSVLSLKKYITNYLNNKYLDILYNGQTVRNKLILNDLCRNNRNIKRLLFQVINKKEAKRVKEEEKKMKIYTKEINEIKNNNYNLNNELQKLKKENSEEKLETKNSDDKFKNINDIYEKQQEEIKELQNELTKINDDIDYINKFYMNNKNYLIEENNKFEIISRNMIKKSNSIEYLASSLTIIGNINKASKNPKSRSFDYTTTTNSNVNNTTNNMTLTNSEIVTDSNNNNILTTGSNKKETNKIIDIIDKDKEIIKKGYNPQYFEIDFKTIDKDLSLENNPNIDNFKKWFTIFKYLDINNQLLFSLIDRQNGVFILYYWLYYLNYKIKKVDYRKDIISIMYSTIMEHNSFTLSRFAKTAFKMLNNATYSKTFEKPISFFKDEKHNLISTYKLLFQLTNIYKNEDIINMEDEIFLNKMIENIKTRNGEGEATPLGNYIQDLLLKKLDVSFENVVKINEILKKYNISVIVTNEISKIDKTTGVICALVKDVLYFMGFFFDEKNKDDKIIQRNNIIIEFQNNLNLKEKYQENTNKIKNIILNKYNFS